MRVSQKTPSETVAYLRETYLLGANLFRANLFKANLSYANLSEAYLGDEQITIWRSETRTPSSQSTSSAPRTGVRTAKKRQQRMREARSARVLQ